MNYRQLILVFVLSCLIFGCKNNNGNKVGLLIHQEDNRWSMDINFLKEYFEKAGIELIIKNADGDENKQLKQAEELIDEDVTVILVVAVNQNTAAGIVRLAHEAGKKVVGYDRMIKNADLDYLLSFKYDAIGKDLVQYAHDRIPRGNYILFWGDAFDDNARAMQKAEMDFLQPFIDAGEVKIVYKTYIDNWSYENAYHKMNQILDLTDEKIDVIIANNDRLAIGTLDALKLHNYPYNVLVTSHDATLEGCRLIAKGELAMTIYKPISELARKAVSLSEEIIKHEKVKATSTVYNGRINVQAILLDPVVVDQSNLESTVIKDNLHTHSELFN